MGGEWGFRGKERLSKSSKEDFFRVLLRENVGKKR